MTAALSRIEVNPRWPLVVRTDRETAERMVEKKAAVFTTKGAWKRFGRIVA